MTLNELFLRLLNLHEEVTNHDFEDQEIRNIQVNHTFLAQSPILLSIQDDLSIYAYEMTLLQLGSSLSWCIVQKPTYFQIQQNGYTRKVNIVEEGLLECDCYYYTSMRMPCQHILACILKFYENQNESTDDEEEEKSPRNKYAENVPKYFDTRWLKRELLNEEELLNFIKNYKFKSNQSSLDESKEENKVRTINII